MADYVSSLRSKTGMKTLFGRKNVKKDNTEGKVSVAAFITWLAWSNSRHTTTSLL